MWVISGAESLGDATGVGLGSSGQRPSQREYCSLQHLVKGEVLRTAAAKVEEQGSAFPLLSVSPGADPHPLCDQQPGAHSDQSGLQRPCPQ